jgi:hypothetical protein
VVGCLIKIFVGLGHWKMILAGLGFGYKPPECVSLLSSACAHGKTDVVRRLLENGADPNAEDANGRSALKLLALRKHGEVDHELLFALIDAGGRFAPTDPSCEDGDLISSPLGSMLINFDGAMARCLCSIRTPHKRLNIPAALLSRALFLSASQPVHIATERDWPPHCRSPIRWLLGQGADPNARDGAGDTALLRLVGRFSPETNAADLYALHTLHTPRDRRVFLPYWRDFLEDPHVDLRTVRGADGRTAHHHLDLLLNRNGLTGAHEWLRKFVIRMLAAVPLGIRSDLPVVLDDKENKRQIRLRWSAKERVRKRAKNGY